MVSMVSESMCLYNSTKVSNIEIYFNLKRRYSYVGCITENVCEKNNMKTN